jgi:pimeloyl-ACP methyl ester carboxylesterase
MPEVRVDGARIVYEDAGAGEPLLLLHGYPQSRLAWRHQLPALARTHRVLAPDWLGWGESERPLALSFRYDEEVRRIGRFLDAVGVPRAGIAAHDYGAHLAVGLVTREPARVARLALLNSRAHRTFPLPSWLLFAAIGVAARGPLLDRLLLAAPLEAIHRRSLAHHVRLGCFDEPLLERYLGWMATADGRRWFVRFFQDYALREPNGVFAGLGAVRVPTAVVWGDRDPYCPPWIARELAARIPDARLEWLPGAHHYVMEERPPEVLAALGRWLAR